MNPAGAVRRNLLPILTAASVFALIVVRACVQSITIDEADTYLAYVAPAEPSHWLPSANNHVLNSMLMRLFVTVFGPSEVVLRIPALIGAALYVAASSWICRLLTRRLALRVVLFLCLACNPFVLDYLVAARGYSLGIGLLMAAVAIGADAGLRYAPGGERRMMRACGIASALLGLSSAASFSFALADATLMLAIAFIAYRRIRPDWRGAARLAGWCAVPGLIVFLFLAAPVVLKWPEGQLVYGAKSVRQMWMSFFTASFPAANPFLVNSLLQPYVDGLRAVLLPIILCGLLGQGIALVRAFRKLEPRAQRRAELGALLLGVVLVTLAMHWIAFRASGLLLPENRTGLYFVVLITLAAGVAASIEVEWRVSRIGRGLLTVGLGVLAAYFLCCARLTYFQQWPWNAENRELYGIVADQALRLDAKDIESNWKWVSSLNYYRSAAREQRFGEITGPEEYSKDRKLYVLDFLFDQQFIRDEGLQVVHHSELTDATVAIRTGAAQQVVDAPMVSASIRNLSRPGAGEFYPGETFELVIEGPVGGSVYVGASRDSGPVSAQRYGVTDLQGRYTIEGKMTEDQVGSWREVWWVGTNRAPTLEFTVRPRP